jgi:molybdopterin/thiamine biosynthesis adenylyltransferase
MGPVAGIIAAAQLDLALALIDGDPVGGQLVTFDGWTNVFRRRTLAPRDDCTLCGGTPRIQNIEPLAYTSPACAG